ncbi:MAG TPA: energy transducer TonB [Vicinamibacterales bacterium]
MSLAIHAIVFLLLIYFAFHKQITQTVKDTQQKFNVVFLDQPGPGGGGGGSPKPPEPVKQAKIMPVKPPPPTPIPKPVDVPDLNIPIKTPDTTQMLPGALSADALGISAGTGGTGGGIGSGTGNGVGPGTGGGYGGGAYAPGNGITEPLLIHDVKPAYTGDAMRAKIQGIVDMEAIVKPDGTVDVTSLKITRSLDSTFGLDNEAKKAVVQWRFRPGLCQRQGGCGPYAFGQPVATQIIVELTFTLR